MSNNSVVLDITHGLISFPQLTIQVETVSSQTTAKPQLNFVRTTNTIIVGHLSQWNTIDTVTPLEKFTKTANLLISQSLSIIFDRRVAVRVSNTTESPYIITKNTQIAEISVVTPK